MKQWIQEDSAVTIVSVENSTPVSTKVLIVRGNIFWRLFSNFHEGGHESLNRTRKFVDSTNYPKEEQTNILNSNSLLKIY